MAVQAKHPHTDGEPGDDDFPPSAQAGPLFTEIAHDAIALEDLGAALDN